MNIRLATPADAEALLAIYAPYVQNTAASFEYEAPGPEEFRQRIEHTLKEYPYLVAEEDGYILGYAYAGPFRPRMAYRHSAEVSIYVRPEEQGKGIGRALYEKLEELLAAQNVYNLYADVASPNAPDDPYLTRGSELFHEKVGYRTIGRYENCGFKFGRWYTLLCMEKVIAERPADPQPFRPF